MIKYYRNMVGSIHDVLPHANGVYFTGLYESSNGDTLKNSLNNDTGFQLALLQQVSVRVYMSLDQ